jgi:glycosyltransferase involved in cell wall biosynthesis
MTRGFGAIMPNGETTESSGTDSRAAPVIALSIVVPCFNEAENLKNLYRELTEVCNPIVGNYEIILVNDGSRDRSWPEMQALADGDSHVVAIDLSRNFGHQIALSAGLSISRGARILTIDADLQDPPELVVEMMRLMDGVADVVYGQRISREGETTFKKLSARIFYRVLSGLSDVPIPPDAGDFRLMRREVLEVLLTMPEQHRFIRGMVAWAGFNQIGLPYARRPRAAGSTNYNLVRMVRFAADAITGFSISPLRISLFCSLFFFAVSAAVLAYVVFSYFFLKVVAGWTSTLILISLFSAVQLLCLGIIGEYVGRIFLETKHRPLFVIREISGQGRPAKRDS